MQDSPPTPERDSRDMNCIHTTTSMAHPDGLPNPHTRLSTHHHPLKCPFDLVDATLPNECQNDAESKSPKEIRLDCRWPGDSYWQKWKKNDTQYPIGGSQMRSYSLSCSRSPVSVYLCAVATRSPTQPNPPQKKKVLPARTMRTK